MEITTIGIDLAKNVFQLPGVTKHGKISLRRQLRRDQMAAFFANLPPCLIGMEACGSAHQWARKLQTLGQTVKLMAPQFVKPYVKSNKNDAADAGAICKAVARPTMRFAPIKNIEQQTVLSLHRVRQGFDARNFDNGRQLAAWLGLVPRQHFSGGKSTLLGMSKRGDAYLRTLLIHGARSVLIRAAQRNDENSWLVKLTNRRNANVAAVALANKTARTVWELLFHDREYKPDYAAAAAAA
jgi:transposase